MARTFTLEEILGQPAPSQDWKVSPEEDAERKREAAAIIESERLQNLQAGRTDVAAANQRELDRLGAKPGVQRVSMAAPKSYSLEDVLGAKPQTFSLEQVMGLEKPKVDYSKLEPTGAEVDYSAAATSMEGAPQPEPIAAPEPTFIQRGPGFMLRPEFVQEVRSTFAAIPPEKRRAALEQAAKGRGAEAQAAQRILEEVRAEDERRRIDMIGQERMARILAEAPRVPVKGGAVSAPPPVQFPDVTPTFVEEIDRLKVPEAERVKKRLARDEAERAIAAAQATPEAVGEREIDKRRGETQFLSELWTGAKRAAMVDLPTMWEGAGLFKDVGAAATLNQRLDLFDRIDRGEITSPDELRGLDISNAQARSYLSTTPENREKMRGRLINQIGDRKDLISTAIRTIEDYQQDAAQYRPLVDKPRNIGSKEDFVNWLGSTMGSGAVQMAPLMLAAAGTGGVGLTTLSAGMGLAESVGNRLKYIKDQVKDLPKEKQTDAIIEYLQKTGDTTLLSGIVSGALDAVLGPEARLLKMRANEIAKEATRLGAVKRELKQVPGQVAGEGVTGALQQAVQIAAGVQLKEKPEFWTKENIIDILESGAEEAAGSLGGAGVNVGIAATRRPPGAPRPAEPTMEEPPAAQPTAPLSAEDRQLLLDNAQQRLAELELKARGKEEQVITTPEGKKVRLPAEAAQFLTDDERAELAFLRGNATNADALQRAYEVSAEQEAAPGKDVTDILQTIEEARQLMAARRGEEAAPPAVQPPVAPPTVAEEVAEPPAEPREIEPLPEQLAGEPMPKTPEVVDAERILDEMYAERDKIEEQKVGSLWAKVKGRLADSDVKDLGDKKRYTFLRAGKQKAPTTIADMVADGTLDAWLPFDMRHDAPNFDGQVSEEYIKDKLRNGDYTNFERRMAIDQIMDQAESYERLINEEFTLEEINREIQLAADEQRQIDQALEEPAAEGEIEVAGEREEGPEFLSIEPSRVETVTVQPPVGEQRRNPSFKRTVKFLNRKRETGRITDQQFIKDFEEAVRQDEQVVEEDKDRTRGATWIRERLLRAYREGDLSREAVDFAEWFIKQNEALVDDLGISIKGKGKKATAGQYLPFQRVMLLIKGSAGDSTVVHEILHHLERMMPADVQAAIRKEWLGRLLQAKRNAKTPEDKAFFELLMSHHFGDGSTRNIRWPAGSEKLRDRLLDRANKGEFENSYAAAIEMLRSGIVSADKLYQYVNPSEFWAVNGTEIVKGRFNAIRGGVLARLKNWLKELGQTIKALFGLRSDAPLIKALDSLAKGDGKFVSKKLIGEGDTFLQISRQPAPPSAPTPAAPPEKPLLARAAPILFSADELNRPQFRPGVAAYKGVANIANKVLDKLYLKPASPELARAMRDMKAEINKVQNKLADVAAKLEKLPIAEREMISDVIEGELLAGVTPPKHVLDIAAAMQQMMREGADEAIRLDMLSPQAVQRWGDKYLPRFYQNKLRDDTKAWARAARALFARQPMMKGVVGRQFKGRGMFYTIDVNELPDWIAEGWEQRDPEFDPATSTETVVWRDYTREERENMGEIRDAMFRFVMGYNGIQRDLALGRLYESLADEYASKVRKEGYVRVPDIKVEGTNANRYGKLAGLYVPKEIMDHLALNDQSMMDGVYKIYRAGLAKWKEGKTVLNPVAHANNVLSNVTMAHFAGVSYWDGHKYVGAVKDLAKNSDMVKEADDVGLFGGTFSQEEFMGSMPPKLRQMANMTASSAAKLGDKIWDTLAYTVSWNGKKFGARPVMQWMYDGEDKFFRYVIYRDARLRGMDPKDARDYAQQFIFTYDDLPKGARLIRDLGMPFFGYTYKVVPVMLQTVAKYPWRFAAPASLAYAANAMMYAMAASLGGDEDDWWGKVLYKYVTDPEFRKKAQELEDEERKNLPPWLKGLSSLATPKAIRLWMDDATNLPLFLDISRIFPGGDLLDAENNAGGVAFLQPLTPNNPVLTTLVAMLANRDMFRGKDVVESTDTPTEKAAKQGAWLWKQITPAISVGNYHFDRAMNVIANITGKPITVDAGDMGSVSYTGVGKDGLPVQPKQALLQTMGVKVRPYDLEQSQEIEEGKQKKMIREIQFDMSRLDRLFDKGSISEEAYDIEYKKLEKKRDFLEEGLTVSGKEKK